MTTSQEGNGPANGTSGRSREGRTVGIVIQARMGSTRLPQKVMKKVNERSLLAYQLERLKRCKNADKIIVATTVEDKDDLIIDELSKPELSWVHSFRGSEADVLDRFHKTATKFGLTDIVRLTADCPIIDPEIVDSAIDLYFSTSADYCSNTMGERTYPRGQDTEVFSFELLDQAHRNETKMSVREHVTQYFHIKQRENADNPPFKMIELRHPSGLVLNQHRWTIDEQCDFDLVSRIIESLIPKKPNFQMQDVLDLLTDHPDWAKLNAHVEQKKVASDAIYGTTAR